MKNRQTTGKGLTAGYEEARINALRRYRIADSVPEEIFSHYVQMATLIFRVPAAFIAFVDENCVHYKASIGIGDTKNGTCFGTFCTKTLLAKGGIYTTQLLKISPACESLSTYGFYAGASIVTPDGYSIGCLSLLDHKVHKLTVSQFSVLKILSSTVADALEDRIKTFREEERRLQLLTATQEGLWEWHIPTDKIWWNDAFSMLFGYPEIHNISYYNLDFWCNRFDNDVQLDVKNAMQSFSLDGEYQFKKNDGIIACVIIRSAIIRDESGRVIKLIGSIHDISNRFYHEELNKKNQIELIRHKDEFISVASHEIRTPITIIKSYSQIIKKETNRDIYQYTKLSGYAERIERQSEKLLSLIENLLDVSRINLGKMFMHPEAFDLVPLLNKTIDELDSGEPTHTIELKGAASFIVYADKFRISQVLTNLITNAIKYSPGADKVVISYEKNTDKNTATIAVKDFGKGISKEDKAGLFQKFQRIINPDTDKISGIGLGLNIAMEIVKLHGSTIKLDSMLGKGSMFSFELPLVLLSNEIT